MEHYAEKLFQSMIDRDITNLPLADTYRATENCVPAALNNMTMWRTVTGLNYISQTVIDKTAGQLFITANLDENGQSLIFWGRIKIENKKISEFELYTTRSIAEAGFVFLPDEMNKLPKGWTSEIPEGGKATRAELEKIANAIFDISDQTEYPSSEECILMEMGGVVYEDPEYLDLLMDAAGEAHEKHAPDALITIPAGLWPVRPGDEEARVLAIDEEQGVVVSFGTIPGYVSPYVVTKTTGSCFVPARMIEMHHKTLKEERYKGRNIMQEMPTQGFTCEMVRYHSGKIQGVHRYVKLAGTGARSPWGE